MSGSVQVRAVTGGWKLCCSQALRRTSAGCYRYVLVYTQALMFWTTYPSNVKRERAANMLGGTQGRHT